MSSKQIKGLTVEIGGDTSKLGQALKSVDDKSASLSSELKNINALLKLDPSNTELLAQKQKVLADAISNTEEKLKILKEAEQQAQAQFEKGEISAEQYRALQREVIAAETKLNQYKNALDETAQAAADLEKGTEQTTHELKKQEEQTEETKRETVELDSSMGDAVKGGFAALIAAAGAAITAIAALAESTREYRTEMAKLDTAYKTSGHSSQTATAAYKELQSVIGETDQAVEAAQQIALLADSAEDVAEWSGLAAGLVGRLGDALKPETFYEAANETLKLGEATGAFTQMLEQTGANVEEFNQGLAACTTTEEKQAYMLGVAKEALGAAATQYKRTNAELIRANNANEDWNATLAECGEVVEPVVTDVKELGTALLKKAKQPLKEVANYIRNTFLPALTKVGSWAKQNLPQISATIAGVTATLVAHKVATLAAELASKGWTVATLAQAAAQKVLNAVMSASPWGLALTAVTGITAAMAVFIETSEAVQDEVSVLTEDEQALIDAANEAAQAFRNQQEVTKEAMEGTVAQMDHVQDLADELLTLADASGAVQEKDQARANLILGELNKALGTEYSMIDGVIQQYEDLKTSIDNVITSKLANALLENAEQDYVTAVENKSKALEAMLIAEAAYNEQLAIDQAAQEALTKATEDYNKKKESAITLIEKSALTSSAEHDALLDATAAADKSAEALVGLKASYDAASANYENYANTIITYNQAQTAAFNGNYEQVKDLLVKESQAYISYGFVVDEETRKYLDTLYKKAVETGEAANLIKKNFENGVSGFTEDMVSEAEQAASDALDAFANAYADAASIGEDLGNGLCVGLEKTRPSLISKGISMVKDYLAALRTTADSHSPAQKTIDFGEDVGEGAVIGVDNKTKDVAQAGQRQAEALLDAYSSQELRAQSALSSIADRQAAAQAGSYMSAGAQNAGVLNKILAAIEKGQVITINGDLLVGATEGTMDSALGVRQILAERGAL